MSTTLAAGDVLAKSGEAVKAGPIGLVVILLLCIAAYFLFKSMSKHLRKVREEFPADPPAAANSAGAGGTAAGDVVTPPADRSPNR